jgi:hypothetical protein
MATGVEPAGSERVSPWQSVAIVLAAVALCLLLAGLVAVLVPRDLPRLPDVSGELTERSETPPPPAPLAELESPLIEARPTVPEPSSTPPSERLAAPPADAGLPIDSGPLDAAPPFDAGLPDAALDASPPDAGPANAAPTTPEDAGSAGAAPAAGEPCGASTCAPGKVCCNASCGTCTNPGETCEKLVCGMSVVPESVRCGPNTCNVGEVCCNDSCGFCVLPGEPCDTKRRCYGATEYPQSQMCGMQTCNVGFACCNPSCGICKRPGEPCSQKACG